MLSGEACISRVPRGVSAAQSRCLRIGHPRSAPISSGTSAPRSLEAGISKAKRRFSKRRTEISKRPQKIVNAGRRLVNESKGDLCDTLHNCPGKTNLLNRTENLLIQKLVFKATRLTNRAAESFKRSAGFKRHAGLRRAIDNTHLSGPKAMAT